VHPCTTSLTRLAKKDAAAEPARPPPCRAPPRAGLFDRPTDHHAFRTSGADAVRRRRAAPGQKVRIRPKSISPAAILPARGAGIQAGIGIIFGANLGTTTGAWLIAGFGLEVNITAYAMPMLAFGVILVLQSATALKGIDYILAGPRGLFLGIH
jgi:hypothetical protein